MSATTPHLIREAVEKTIVNLTPLGTVLPLASRNFVRKSKGGDWADVAQSDLDRRFTVELIGRGTTLSFGGLSEHQARALMTITIGHVKPKDLIEGKDRIAADCRSIMLRLEDAVYYPADVWAIVHEGDPAVTDKESFWLTNLKFVVTYSEAN